MNESVARFVLRLVDKYPGKLDWHSIERRVTLGRKFDIGFHELMALLQSLLEEGLMEARKDKGPELPAAYWITDKGRQALATDFGSVP